MRMSHWHSVSALFCLSALVAGLVGCGHSENQPASTSAAPAASIAAPAAGADTATTGTGQGATPQAAVSEFLTAFKVGNDEKASQLLTPLARKMVAQQHLVVAPRGSDTAKFEVGRVEQLAEDGARVYTTLTDVGDNGQPQSDEIIWMVRHVDDGWRIAGVAAPVFKGEPPLLLNFEDEGDIIKKQQMVHDEIRRRMEQPQQPDQSAAAGGPAASPAADATSANPAGSTTNPAANSPATSVAPDATAPAGGGPAANPTTMQGPAFTAPPMGQPGPAAPPPEAAQRPANSDAGVIR